MIPFFPSGVVKQPLLAYSLKAKVDDARHAANDLKHESLARLMGISSQQLSHQLEDTGHLSLKRILFAAAHDVDGRLFAQALWLALAKEIGLEEQALAVELARLQDRITDLLIRLRPRPAKATLRTVNQKERVS